MKKYFITLVAVILCASNASYAKDLDLEKFGREYFNALNMTQRPEATEQDIENYLAFLTDDVGNQHYPNAPDGSRKAGNKARMRKGMNYYRGTSTEFGAELVSITTGHNVVILKYKMHFKGVHPQLKKEISFAANQVDVLEIEKGKVSVIRKYSESL